MGGGGKAARARDFRGARGLAPAPAAPDGPAEFAAARPAGFFFDFRLGAMAAAYATIRTVPHCGKVVAPRIAMWDVSTPRFPERSHMPRKPNFEFERRERDRLKALKNAEKAAAKKEARERARAENPDAPPKDETSEPA